MSQRLRPPSFVMGNAEPWEAVKFEFEVRYPGNLKSQSRWIASHAGQPKRQAATGPDDLLRVNSATGNWEVYQQSKWKQVVLSDDIPSKVLSEWTRFAARAVTKASFATEFMANFSGVAKNEVLYLVTRIQAAGIVNRAPIDLESAVQPLVAATPEMKALIIPSTVVHPSPEISPFPEKIPTSPLDKEIKSAAPACNGSYSPAIAWSVPKLSDSDWMSSCPNVYGLDMNRCLADEQQERLFNDPRRHQLLDEYAENLRVYPKSHLSSLGTVAQHIFENGRPARVWTAGGIGSAEVGLDPSKFSVHGRSNCTYQEADFLLLTEEEHATWARHKNGPKLIVIRDPQMSNRRPSKTTQTWLREMERLSKFSNSKVDVQRLNRPSSEAAVEGVRLDDALRQWNEHRGSSPISDLNSPLNILNIADNVPGNWPEGLTKEYQVLFDAIAVCDGIIYKSLDEKTNLAANEHDIGKPTLMAFSPTDIQKCSQFRILAQRGAVSSWHMGSFPRQFKSHRQILTEDSDNVGVYTFVVLEGNRDDINEKDEDVVKYWPVFPMNSLTTDEASRAMAEYSKYGITWRPKPKGKIPVISLVRGDMLIQPPGTIHAPITLTDCFFLGGMCWRKDTMPLTLNTWNFLTKHPGCTNEPLPRQTHMILDYVRSVVHETPSEYGYENSPSDLQVFNRICDEICGKVINCSCTTGCKLSSGCSCLAHGLRCGIYCHKGIDHKSCSFVSTSESDKVSPKCSVKSQKRKRMIKRLKVLAGDGSDSDDRTATSKMPKREVESEELLICQHHVE